MALQMCALLCRRGAAVTDAAITDAAITDAAIADVAIADAIQTNKGAGGVFVEGTHSA
jgi:hypothetical protein